MGNQNQMGSKHNGQMKKDKQRSTQHYTEN